MNHNVPWRLLLSVNHKKIALLVCLAKTLKIFFLFPLETIIGLLFVVLIHYTNSFLKWHGHHIFRSSQFLMNLSWKKQQCHSQLEVFSSSQCLFAFLVKAVLAIDFLMKTDSLILRKTTSIPCNYTTPILTH